MNKWEQSLKAIMNGCPDDTDICIMQGVIRRKIEKITYIQYDSEPSVIMIDIENEQPE